MPVTPIEPIVIPQRTFDKFWLTHIAISSPELNGEAAASVALMPYNDLGEKAEICQSIVINNIMAKAYQNPESNIAKAMYFLIAAIDDEYKAQNSPGE